MAAAAAQAQAARPAVPLRRVYSLNRNWLFRRSAVPGADSPGFDESGFRPVTLPHSNIELPWHGFNDKDYEFVSTYRRHFVAPPSWQGKRVFVDFDGVMTASKLTFNGRRFPEYRGGYTPFSFELTPHLKLDADNLLVVTVDSTERPDIPPFGGAIDYLTFGGIYREVALRIVPPVYIENLFAKPVDVLEGGRRVEVKCVLDGQATDAHTVKVELRDGARVLSSAEGPLSAQPLTLSNLGTVELWDLDHPKLYSVHARLYQRCV